MKAVELRARCADTEKLYNRVIGRLDAGEQITALLAKHNDKLIAVAVYLKVGYEPQFTGMSTSDWLAEAEDIIRICNVS